MELIVNGSQHTCPAGLTVRGLIEQLGLGKAAVAVEVNQSVVPRKQHDSTALHEGDRVELVTLVGGG